MKKRCTECGVMQELSYFPIRGEKADGTPSYRSLCKGCWRKVHNMHNRTYRSKHSVIKSEPSNTVEYEVLIKALAELARNSPEVLGTLSKEDFVTFTGYEEEFSFSTLKENTYKYLDSIGIGNPSHKEFTEDGCYLVIGDTYGMKTRSGMFDLLNNIISMYEIKDVIVIGRNLDDNDNISNRFNDLQANITFIPTADELSKIHALSADIGADIYREYVTVGNITIRNQEQITPYVKKAVSTLDPLIFRGNTIVNCSRMEYATRYGNGAVNFIASPGTLAEPHVPKVINKLLLTNGATVKQVFHHSFKKYRKAEEDKTLWQMGCILLTKKGSITVPTMMPIKKVDGEYTTVNGDVVITEHGIQSADSVEVVVADVHTPKHNKFALQTVLAYLSDMSLNNVVNIYLAGDIIDSESVNPHILGKGEYPERSVAEEMIAYDSMLESFRNVLNDDSYVCVIEGNHYNFINRWCKKNPQFRTLLESIFHSINENHKVDSVPVEGYTLSQNDVVITHGDADVSVQGSTNVEKLARSFGSAICGHSHSTNMRYGALRVGCLAQRNQGYNSPYCSWDYSIGVITNYRGEAFVSFMKVDDTDPYFCMMTNGNKWWNSNDGANLVVENIGATVEVFK